MVDAIKSKWEKYQKKKAIKRIRSVMAFFGCNISDMSDEEIEQASMSISNTFAKAGVPAASAAKILSVIGRVPKCEYCGSTLRLLCGTNICPNEDCYMYTEEYKNKVKGGMK